MFGRRRLSRPNQVTSYTGVSNTSNGAAPASNALAAASVIGKALKDNNHNPSGLNLPQQPQKNTSAHRTASLLGTRRDSLTARSNSVTNNTVRAPPSRTNSVTGTTSRAPPSRSSSLNYHPSSPMVQRRPISQQATTHHQQQQPQRTQSLTTQSKPVQRLQTRQSSASLQQQQQQQQRLKHRVSFSESSSSPTSGSFTSQSTSNRSPAPRQAVPATPKMIKKWVPSAHGLVCIEVPAPANTAPKSTASQRAIARSASMNSLSNNTRNGVIRSSGSLTGVKPPIPGVSTTVRSQNRSSSPGSTTTTTTTTTTTSNNLQPPRQTLKQKASLQSMHTQGHSSLSFEPTILEDEADGTDLVDNGNSKPVDINSQDLDQLKTDYLDEIEKDRLEEEKFLKERDVNEANEMIQRERAFSSSDEPIDTEQIFVPSDVSQPIEDGIDDETVEENYTESERLLADQRLEELVKLKEIEIMETIRRQKQLENSVIDSSLVSVASSQLSEEEEEEDDDDDDDDDAEVTSALEVQDDAEVTSTLKVQDPTDLTDKEIVAVPVEVSAPVAAEPAFEIHQDAPSEYENLHKEPVSNVNELETPSTLGTDLNNINNPLNEPSTSEYESEDHSEIIEDEDEVLVTEKEAVVDTEPVKPLNVIHPLEAVSKASIVSSNYGDLVDNYAQDSSYTLQAKSTSQEFGTVLGSNGESVSTAITSQNDELDTKTPTTDEVFFDEITTPTTITSNNKKLDGSSSSPSRSVFESEKPQSMAQRLRPTLGVTPPMESKPTFVNETPTVLPILDDVKDIQIPERSHRRLSSVSSSPIQTAPAATPEALEPEVIPRRKSILKNNSSSSRLSLSNQSSASNAYLSAATAEHTRLNAMASSSSLNLSTQISPSRQPQQQLQTPSQQQSQSRVSPVRPGSVRRSMRDPPKESQHQQPAQQNQKAGFRSSMRQQAPNPQNGKRMYQQQQQQQQQQQLQQQQNGISHHLAAAAKAAQQYNTQNNKQPLQPQRQSHHQPAQQSNNPGKSATSPRNKKSSAQIRASELYKKANLQQTGQENGFYNNPYPEHLKPGLKRTSSFEKVNEVVTPTRKNRLTLRDELPQEQQQQQQQYQYQYQQEQPPTYNNYQQQTPSQRHSRGPNTFKSRFDDSDDEGDSPPVMSSLAPSGAVARQNNRSSGLNFKPSLGTMRSVSVEAASTSGTNAGATSNGNNGTRFFSEQIPDSRKLVSPVKPSSGDNGHTDEKKKRFGKLRKLFGNKN
ncbi:hypothetical protein CANARDRAFT_8216 [[Candida] arabinofermentans NRRL YB-2248]|uniref:Eisosome protein SEG1 n=1 Tax=[Candida] arabinofermentans NRRL YB-2248 TaxID=983967 RepID=A0A1E4T020_9ASCO|nr:hypothetical protein CANARDRAFT_8216 [[Candida] arabinofermentans NRRL YB-2248]